MFLERPGVWKASLGLPDDVRGEVGRLAAAEGCSMNALMVRMVEQRVRELELSSRAKPAR